MSTLPDLILILSKMDKIDQKMFKELDINPRIPLSNLAKKLRISQQVADYRLKRMLEKGQITKLAALINLKALGLEHYRVFLNLSSKEYSPTELFDYLKQKKGVYWAARIGGKYDLHLVLFVKDFEEFDRFIDDFNHKFPRLIKNIHSEYVIDHLIYKHKFYSQDYSKIAYGYNDKIKEIDELDNYILDKIKDNCRISSLELSKETKVSYKTISNRIKRLEKENIILGYRLFIKSENEKPFLVLFSFKNYSKKNEKDLISYLEQKDSVTQTLRLFGVWNLYLHIRIEDNEKLQNFIMDIRNKFDIIDEYEIIPIFQDISINLLPI